jgi:hypothetical protein
VGRDPRAGAPDGDVRRRTLRRPAGRPSEAGRAADEALARSNLEALAAIDRDDLDENRQITADILEATVADRSPAPSTGSTSSTSPTT